MRQSGETLRAAPTQLEESGSPTVARKLRGSFGETEQLFSITHSSIPGLGIPYDWSIVTVYFNTVVNYLALRAQSRGPFRRSVSWPVLGFTDTHFLVSFNMFKLIQPVNPGLLVCGLQFAAQSAVYICHMPLLSLDQ